MRYKIEDGKIVIHAPEPTRQAFQEYLDCFYQPAEEGDDPAGVYYPEGRSSHQQLWLLGYLWDCTDVLPVEYCELAGLDQGSTYGQAARKLAADLADYDPALKIIEG